MQKTLSDRSQELNNKVKVQLGNPRSGRGRIRELFNTNFKPHYKRSFTKAGRLREWLQGELRLYPAFDSSLYLAALIKLSNLARLTCKANYSIFLANLQFLDFTR